MSPITKSLVTLFSQDLGRSLAFYRDRLGLRETYRYPTEGTPMHVEFEVAGSTVAISSDAGLLSHGMPKSSPGHSFELGFKTTNVDDLVAELRVAGVTILREPFDSEAGNRVAYITDPDGNWISLYHNRG